MPEELIRALGAIKRAAALVNTRAGQLDSAVGSAIAEAAAEVRDGKLSSHFPLIIWQTGSATQTNMNANEVIARRASQLLTQKSAASAIRVHPNDHVNKGQSSNDTIPTAMHVATALQLKLRLLPALKQLQESLELKAAAWAHIIKVGRTHAQDATPLTLGQEFSGYAAQVAAGVRRVEACLPDVLLLAQGATAVGTGLNTWQGFDVAIAEQLAEDTGLAFSPAPNKFEAIASHDALVHVHGALNTLAASFMKIGNDMRLLASGPRCGIGELLLPSNEPGSSIMPGKVNPTQCEMLTMVCCQVMGNHVAVTTAGALGLWELNAFKPVIIANVLRSVRLLADAAVSFSGKCVQGCEANEARIAHHLEHTLMSVTALVPHIGYDKAAAIAKTAVAQHLSLAQAAAQLGIDDKAFRLYVDPKKMLEPFALVK
ncbi:fumarate hydratase [Haematococcus lacustris]|uniref:fumarate hydratase n=1 Tax=Haematococcus lacustris TaxID=44745 RepID=A0A699YZ01_HAELA|nr:fumarate hydratase [Haematococcus lacustris]